MTEESIREKRESDPIIDGGELPCGCWLLNSGSSEEQSVLLTTEPFLLSLGSDFFFCGGHCFFMCVVLEPVMELALLDQAGFKLTEICLSLTPESSD